ncbi:MAG: hypothetical protein COA57_14985 [Flavobacteriales bacterium]|nr:MAG: hypothetical protein COA57_14985 [Flavobacteriales bacterium]
MQQFLETIRNQHDLIFKGFLTVLCIGLLVYIMPKEGRFKYEFQKGKPWLHEDLIAPFDFAILKSKEQLDTEKQQIRESTKPYFKYDEAVVEKQVESLTENFEKKWPESEFGKKDGKFSLQNIFGKADTATQAAVKATHLKTGSRILTTIYEKGIIKIDDIIEDKPYDFSIVVLKYGNVAEERELGNIYTLQSAYDEVKKLLKTASRYSRDERASAAAKIDAEFLQSLIENHLFHNVFYEAEISQKIIGEKIDNISISHGIVLNNEKIISKGNVVTLELHQKLISLKQEYEKQLGGSSNYWFILTGQIILVSILVAILMAFLFLFRKDLIAENNKITFILLLLALMVYMSAISMKIEEISIYFLPFCILPIIIRTFYDIRLAIFAHLIATILMGFQAPNGFEFILIQLIAGIVAVFSIVQLRRRSQIYATSFYVFLAYSFTYFGIAVIQEGDWKNIDWMNFAWFGASAMLTLFAYPLMYVFEKLFGFLSDVSLMELADPNSKLLRELNENAPGTMQHSLQVANLSEEVVHQIGGNALLVRTGALYHDIGKMYNPAFFIENQQGFNPHDEISHEESANIIIKHVIKGVEMAKKHNLPEPIIDFIRTHHGTTLTRYFYNSYKQENPEEADENKFRYPGPVPHSKEAAILMMADAVEAASRSLKKHNEETINSLVEGIVDSQANEQQFVNAAITFKDLTEAKKIFKKKLMNIYHVRIEYPK